MKGDNKCFGYSFLRRFLSVFSCGFFTTLDNKMLDIFTTKGEALAMRDEKLDLVETNNNNWVKEARERAIAIAKAKGTVTIDDVLKDFPRPYYINQNATGAVLRCRQLKLLGYTVTTKKTSNGRRIGIYGYTQENT